MPARTPDEIGALFTAALNAGDLDAVMRCYEPTAALKPMRDQVVAGAAAVRAALAGFIAMKPRMTLAAKTLVAGEGLALTTSNWTLEGTGPDGAPLRMSGQGVEVARRQADGTWLWALDTPWGLEWNA